MKTVFSFDVFDTCLCRLCGDPRMLFDVLSLKVKQAMNENASEHMRQLFVAARANAGGRNLYEIYEHVSQHFPLPCTVERMMELELETEKEMLVPIAATLRLVNQARKKGDVLFISDMYLPSSFIRERLSEYGFFQEGDRLYVSDEFQAWKHDGSLYRLVREKENISYRRWHHYGDNFHSDVKTPRRLGIHAHHLQYDYLYYEERWKQQLTVGFQYPSIMAGISRAVRLQSEASDSQTGFVSDLTAPFMVNWVYGLMRNAQQRGIRRLLFLARDVHSEYLIAKRFQPQFPKIELGYLLISSKALYENELVSKYLQQQGLLDNKPTAIVDSCSSGRTLKELNVILKNHHCNQWHGYLAVKFQTKNSPNVDLVDYLFNDPYLTALTPKRVNRIIGMRIFFELLFSLNFHSTLVGYEYHGETIRPVFGKDNNDDWYFDNKSSREVKRDNDKLLSSFTDAFLKTNLSVYNDMVMERLALPTLLDFVDRPQKEYLDYLRHFIWKGKPFVGKLVGPKQGVWKRGNRAYSLPSWLYSIISNTVYRKKFNKLASWITSH